MRTNTISLSLFLFFFFSFYGRYKCPRKNCQKKFSSVDTDFLKLLPFHIRAIFDAQIILTANSGICSELLEFVLNLAVAGATISAIQGAIRRTRSQAYCSTRLAYVEHAAFARKRSAGVFRSAPVNLSPFPHMHEHCVGYNESSAPTEEFLRALVLAKMKLVSQSADRFMSNIDAVALASDQHHASMRRIGVTDDDTSRVSHPIDGMVAVMNERSQVLYWKYTSSTSNNELQEVAKVLSPRLKETVKMWTTDRCCLGVRCIDLSLKTLLLIFLALHLFVLGCIMDKCALSEYKGHGGPFPHFTTVYRCSSGSRFFLRAFYPKNGGRIYRLSRRASGSGVPITRWSDNVETGEKCFTIFQSTSTMSDLVRPNEAGSRGTEGSYFKLPTRT
jgi:hypothetical protein